MPFPPLFWQILLLFVPPESSVTGCVSGAENGGRFQSARRVGLAGIGCAGRETVGQVVDQSVEEETFQVFAQQVNEKIVAERQAPDDRLGWSGGWRRHALDDKETGDGRGDDNQPVDEGQRRQEGQEN